MKVYRKSFKHEKEVVCLLSAARATIDDVILRQVVMLVETGSTILKLIAVIVGFASCTVPMYIAECSPVHLRGRLGIFTNLCITGGQFVASVMTGFLCYNRANGWRYFVLLCAELSW